MIGLAEWLRRRAVRGPDSPALTCDETTWTYRQLQDQVELLSSVLASCGVGAGDRVAYLGFNDPMFLVALFATARIGAIFVPLNFRLTGAELQFVKHSSRPTCRACGSSPSAGRRCPSRC